MLVYTDEQVVPFDDAARAAAQEWMLHFQAHCNRQPADELFKLFKRDTTVHIVNQANSFCRTAFEAKPGEDAMLLMNCTNNLYYRALHSMLLQQAEDEFGDPDPDVVRRIVGSASLQLGLLACAAELVQYATAGDASFPELMRRVGALRCVLDMWEGLAHMRRILVQIEDGPSPESLDAYAGYMRVRITEELAWARGSPLYALMAEGGGGSTPAGDTALLEEFIEVTRELAMQRARAAAAALCDGIEELALVTSFVQDCEGAAGVLVNCELDLLFGQHLSRAVSCCIYALARVHNVAVAVKRVNQAVAAVCPHHGLEVFQASPGAERAAEPEEGREQPWEGWEAEQRAWDQDVRNWYNDAFIPRMREHIVRPEAGAAEAEAGTELERGATKDKAGSRPSRLPLRSLSAKDINTRQASRRISLMQ